MDPANADSDGDGTIDGVEVVDGTDSLDDSDGLDDGTDQDGLTDAEEVLFNTDANDTYGTDPLEADSDSDGIAMVWK